ncbi:NFX1-type zinc finger-containing protein 1-like [Daphnia carinata]|uniref:NFX1-type zinc finger-containing protein 1-like n=1 Tax=Daphnia carinata TaxID=120202 RepID=UPI002579D330|nr:NFX1-type zinc finger-containing protein 1-like [Daphnia carinata]
MPSIKNLNVADAFDVLEDGIQQLQTAWSQHIPLVVNKEERRTRREKYLEELIQQDPPNDFRTLNVMPNWEDVCMDFEPFLRPNIVKGKYPDIATYLDIQFRLLREDFFNPLRVGLLAYKSQTDKKFSRIRNPDNIRLYYEVQILEYHMHEECYTIQFSNAGLRRIVWEHSKRFLYGSLLCLSSDNFKSFHLFTVLDRNPKLLEEGKIKVKFEGGTLSAALKKQKFVMVESTVFSESYRSTLTALQRISPTNFPFEDYILGRNTSPVVPDYLNAKNALYDLRCVSSCVRRACICRVCVRAYLRRVTARVICGGKGGNSQVAEISDADDGSSNEQAGKLRAQEVPILEPSLRPNANELGLDPSQCTALYAALTQKISVIQGPPGTGKTYLALKIVQTLLKNKQHWNNGQCPLSSPILVICYTNHALDQFLEGISKFTHKIVRIGSQSKCAALEPFSLMAWKKQPGRYSHGDTRKWIFEINDQLREIDKERDVLRGVMMVMHSRGLIHEDSLLYMKIIPKSLHSAFEALKHSMVRSGNRDWTALGCWLGIYRNEDLQQLFNCFSKNSSEKHHATKNLPVVSPTEENETADDQWDKALIEEIQTDRKVEDDDHLASVKAKAVDRHSKPEDEALKKVFVKFSYKSSEDETLIKEYRESLETMEGEDVAWYEFHIQELQNRILLLRQLLQTVPTLKEKQLDEWYTNDIMRIPLHIRWMMYSSWKVKALDIQEKRITKLEESYVKHATQLKDVRTLESAEICQNADIVGLTATGAAKQRALLNHLKPKIVIVEEAAKVLEAHVVCALSSSCQQLVLIGDHQQLRPPVTVHRLAKDFFLDVSLFERLIKNGMEPCILGVQRRMRPEIARLIVPAIYPTLENHSSVLNYPAIRGLASNIFFLTHSEQEIGDHEGKSHLNPYEAQLSLALARHLIMQGYAPKQITILTTYSGQLLHFFKIRREQPAVQSVRISVVDNFQGEENDIIILSLVRSNEDENIGILRIENRICVALSRAKQGFYMIGNMQNLQGKSKLWNGIRKMLETNGQLGPDFELQCRIHDVITKARKVADFPPEGGCMENCAVTMGCGHVCPRICHVNDRKHTQFKCKENCTRFCPVGHPCPKKCFADCNPCVVRVTKKLPCTHEQIVLCYKDPAKEFCQTPVWKILPACGHGVDLLCGASVSEAVCPEPCGMTLDCDHICPLSCHKRSSHANVKCQEPCQRQCSDHHPCTKMCFEDCGKCHVKMTKTLPCGHEAEVECSEPLGNVNCNVRVMKTLTECEHTIEIECSKSTDGYKCKKPCEKTLCIDGHPCKKRCFEPCGRCSVRMERQLKCGHSAVVECYVDPMTVRCRILKEGCLLPLCGHRVALHCGKDPYQAVCPLLCNVRLECGHSCTLRCHTRKDPDHQEYQCKKQCGKTKQGCKMNHKCGKKCFEDCAPCNEKWKRTLPCGHSIFTECYRNDEDIFCPKMVTKVIPECGHEAQLECSTVPTRLLCKEMCNLMLPCGHACKKKCCKPCNQADCNEPVTTSRLNICGHHVTLDCKSFHAVDGIPTEIQMQSHLRTCSKPCNATLDCMHRCKGTCGECFNGRVHRAYDYRCGRSLVCGHICDVNCSLTCPPCRKICEYSCSHSRCRHTCSEPCSACQEPCEWKCEHQTCGKKCGEQCDRTRCDEPCNNKLPCGHSCIGLCGEICPRLCRVCDKDQLTDFILLGNEENDDARFIFLPECEHCIEVEGMDHWMATDGGGQIQPKCCPRCKTTVRICMRYGNIIKSTFDDISKAKKKILLLKGNPQVFFERAAALMENCRSLFKKCQPLNSPIVMFAHESFGDIWAQLRPKMKGNGKKVKPSIGSDIRFRIEVNLSVIERVLEMMAKMVGKVNNPHDSRRPLMSTPAPTTTQSIYMAPELRDELHALIQKLLLSLFERSRISVEEHRTVERELERLEYVQAYFVLKSSTLFPTVGVTSSENQVIQKLLMNNVRVLEDGGKIEIESALEKLGAKLKTGLGISDKERREIVSAIGLAQGHWFKCPNGHIYAIGECGGAMEESRCNECNAVIGGRSHRLRDGNSFAAEMDNATRPAYPL